MKEDINTKNKYLGIVSIETYDSLMKKIIFNPNVSIQKFRQLAVIANIPPYLLFKNIGTESIAITSKFEIYQNIMNNVDGKYFTPLAEYMPYKLISAIENNFKTQHGGGENYLFSIFSEIMLPKNNLSKVSIIAFLILLLVYFYYRPHRLKIKKMVNIIKSNKIKENDIIHKKKLKNNGFYDGCFHDISDNLHKIFQDSFINKRSVEEVRYVLINKWKSTYFGKRELLIQHLIRTDGNLRDSIEEIAHAIRDIYESGGILSRSLLSIFRYFIPRRKSYTVKNYKKNLKKKNSKNKKKK